MKKKALTLVEVMIILAIIVLLAVIVITSIISPKIISNEKLAAESLKNISQTYEDYASKHKGSYDETLKNLSDPDKYDPPYLGIDYSSQEHNGYIFSCTSDKAGYVCIARPQIYKETGTKSFSICTGGVLKEVAGDAAPACP